jgi:uncharacterized protein (TIGR04255 family)
MKLIPAPRVVYEHNPLVEVVCQIRFERVMELQTSPPARFQAEFARERYTVTNEEHAAALQLVFGAGADQSMKPPAVQTATIPVTYHFANSEGTKQISVNAEFFAFRCARYERWEKFKVELSDGFEAFQKFYPALAVNRVGLRYKDLIERESLGLEGVPWKDLLSSSIAGLLSKDLFEDSASAPGDIKHSSQAVIRLDDCALLLQTALLLSNDEMPREAFLIDADFFHEQPRFKLDASTVNETLDILHKNAGSLFRRCIKEPLHDALRPRPV